MNTLNDVVIASALNRSLYNLTETVFALGRTPLTVAKQYELITRKLREIYARNEFLSSIDIQTLFQVHSNLQGNEAEMRASWRSLSHDSKRHEELITNELSKSPYSYESDEEVNTLIEDSENAFLDMSTEMSEPASEYDIVYAMRYTSGGALLINDYVIARPRLGLPADTALQEAFMRPYTVIEARGNLTKFKHDINLPNELKNILFRVSKGRFMIQPHITQAMLDQHGISRLEADEDLAKFERIR